MCIHIWSDQTEAWVDYSLVDVVLHIMFTSSSWALLCVLSVFICLSTT